MPLKQIIFRSRCFLATHVALGGEGGLFVAGLGPPVRFGALRLPRACRQHELEEKQAPPRSSSLLRVIYSRGEPAAQSKRRLCSSAPVAPC